MDNIKAANANADTVESPVSEHGGYEMQSYSKLGGTEADEHDMQMLGRTQQLNVRYAHYMFVAQDTNTR